MPGPLSQDRIVTHAELARIFGKIAAPILTQLLSQEQETLTPRKLRAARAKLGTEMASTFLSMLSQTLHERGGRQLTFDRDLHFNPEIIGGTLSAILAASEQELPLGSFGCDKVRAAFAGWLLAEGGTFVFPTGPLARITIEVRYDDRMPFLVRS